MKIDMDELTLENAFNEYLYCIPKYQRPYSWDEENLREFWDDTQLHRDGSYFLGSVVVYGATGGQKKGNRLNVVDGQQRLTTALIFLSVVREKFAELGRNDLVNAATNLIATKDRNNREHFVLTSVQWSTWVERNIQQRPKGAIIPGETIEDGVIFKAYQYFQQRINEIGGGFDLGTKAGLDGYVGKLIEARDAVLDAVIVQIGLESEEDAFVIFETLNTRGMPLRLSHLFKNVLFRTLQDSPGEDTDEKKWDEIRSRVEKPNSEFDLDLYLYHFYSSRYKHVAKKNLYPQLKEIVQKSGAPGALEFFDALRLDSDYYAELANPSLSYFNNAHQFSKVVHAVKYLHMMKITSPMPLLLSLYRASRERRIADRDFIKTVVAIENFHFLVGVAGRNAYNVTGGLAYTYSRCANDINESRTQSHSKEILAAFREDLKEKRGGKDDIFKANFQKILYLPPSGSSASYVRYILSKIYAHLKLGIIPDPADASIEHLIPQSESGGPEWEKAAVGCLGNLVLVSHELNSKLGNKKFSDKAAILQNHGFAADEKLRNSIRCGEMSADSIAERNEYLANRALLAWQIK